MLLSWVSLVDRKRATVFFSSFRIFFVVSNWNLFSFSFSRYGIGRSKRKIVPRGVIVKWLRRWGIEQAKENRSWRKTIWRNGRKDGRETGGRKCWSETFVFDCFPTIHHDFVRTFGSMRHGRSRFRHRLVSLDYWPIAASVFTGSYQAFR